MACNYCFHTRTIFQIIQNLEIKAYSDEKTVLVGLVGLKTHPTIVPRSGFQLTTSRLHSFIMAKVSHALNHSAMEAELTTSRLHSFNMATASHALNHSALDWRSGCQDYSLCACSRVCAHACMLARVRSRVCALGRGGGSGVAAARAWRRLGREWMRACVLCMPHALSWVLEVACVRVVVTNACQNARSSAERDDA